MKMPAGDAQDEEVSALMEKKGVARITLPSKQVWHKLGLILVSGSLFEMSNISCSFGLLLWFIGHLLTLILVSVDIYPVTSILIM